MTRPIDFVTELPKGEFVSSCWRNSVSKMVIKSAVAWTRRKAVRMLEELYFSREPRLQSCLQSRLQARPNELNKQEFPRASSVVSSEIRPDDTFTKKAISRVPGLGLEQSLWRWKANSNIYKVMFHKVQLILMFTRSKRAIKRSRQNSSSAISARRDCRRACVKNTFWTCFVTPSGRHMFPSRRRLPVTVLNELKLLPRSRDDGAIKNRHL
jgi:hypothetical protein